MICFRAISKQTKLIGSYFICQDVIVLSDFEVESYTGLITDTAFYPVQVVVERTEQYEPYVWVLILTVLMNCKLICMHLPIIHKFSIYM